MIIIDTLTKPIIDKFNLARAKLKFPSITYHCDDGSNIKFYLAGQQSKYSGSIMITNGLKYGDANNKFFGYIPHHGKDAGKIVFHDSVGFTKQSEIIDIVNNPLDTLRVNGIKYSNCCFCGIELTNSASLKAGYGPICADKWGLPWGEKEELTVLDLGL